LKGATNHLAVVKLLEVLVEDVWVFASQSDGTLFSLLPLHLQGGGEERRALQETFVDEIEFLGCADNDFRDRAVDTVTLVTDKSQV